MSETEKPPVGPAASGICFAILSLDGFPAPLDAAEIIIGSDKDGMFRHALCLPGACGLVTRFVIGCGEMRLIFSILYISMLLAQTFNFFCIDNPREYCHSMKEYLENWCGTVTIVAARAPTARGLPTHSPRMA